LDPDSIARAHPLAPLRGPHPPASLLAYGTWGCVDVEVHCGRRWRGRWWNPIRLFSPLHVLAARVPIMGGGGDVEMRAARGDGTRSSSAAGARMGPDSLVFPSPRASLRIIEDSASAPPVPFLSSPSSSLVARRERRRRWRCRCDGAFRFALRTPRTFASLRVYVPDCPRTDRRDVEVEVVWMGRCALRAARRLRTVTGGARRRNMGGGRYEDER
jgi:hypothetical protein